MSGPLVSLRRPSREALAAWLARVSDERPSFEGPLPDAAPPGFDLDVYRLELGRGPAVFDAARTALQRWSHCDLGWLDIARRDGPPAPGLRLAMLARVGGVWFANACLVRRVFDEPGPARVAGYEYVTLPAHAEQGAESFRVLQAADGAVSFEIRAVSRPGPWWVGLGKPIVRVHQRRFGRESPAALARAVRAAGA